MSKDKKLGVSIFITLLFPIIVLAQNAENKLALSSLEEGVMNNLETLKEASGIGEKGGSGVPVSEIIISLVNTALTIMVILFSIYLLYGGFLWMTAAGKEEHFDRAKKTMRWVIIGIAITIASMSIRLFVVDE